MTPFWARLVRWTGYSVAIAIIVYATLINASRLLTPYLNEHKAKFENWASELLQSPVAIGYVTVTWNIYEPEVAFDNVTILDQKTHKPTVGIKRIVIDLNIMRSLIEWRPLTTSIKIAGVNLTLHEFKEGQFHIEGLRDISITDDFTGASFKSDSVFQWIFSVRDLVLRKIDIHYLPKKGPEKFVTVDRLSLVNGNKHHLLQGQAWLNQDIPTKVNIKLEWRGEFSDLEHISADLNLYLEGFSLQQFLSHQSWNKLQIQQGLGTAEISARWDQNQLQKLQSDFLIYDLEWKSLQTHLSQNISRISGKIAWNRDGNNQVISGSDILIDFPDHLWPTTSFSVALTPNATGDYAVQFVDVGYLDLEDSKDFAIANGLVSDSLGKTLTAINPKGQLRVLHVVSNDSWSDLVGVSLSTQFMGLTTNEWNKIPGVNNLNGLAGWNGTNGNLKLNSQQAGIVLSSVFPTPLMFDQLRGDVNWQKDANNTWTVNTKNFTVQSADVSASVSAKISAPNNDSPTVNLTSEFSVANLPQLKKYLPMKILEPGLEHWLKNAFSAGSLDLGKATLQGKMSDIPFSPDKGKFEITGTVRNVDLNFAPKWPALRDVTGQLVFSGQALTIDLSTAKILDVPVQKVHAVVNNIGGTAPTILELQTSIHSDLTQGLHFIHSSPLQNKFGKDLTGLNLSGPMDLQFGLGVPLKNTDDITVKGSVTIANAVLALPAWNLALDQMQGTFGFTEDTIFSTPIQARLFDSPVSLILSSPKIGKKTSYVKADLQGTINIPVLEKWLKMSVSDYVQGATTYHAELHLGGHEKNQANEIIVTTDLKGISVNLPEQYGKKAQDAVAFKADIFAAQNQPLKIKLDYGKLLSAAMTYTQSPQNELKLVGGELRLGPGASWQTQRGILVSGKIDALDWARLQKYLPMKGTTTTPLLREINITIGSLNLFGQNFKNMHVDLEKTNNSWQVGLDNQNVRGQLTVPFNTAQQPIQARFARIYLTTSGKTSSTEILDPKSVPAVSFVGDDVRVNQTNLGRVKFNVSPNTSGLAIRELDMSTAVLRLHASGSWQARSTHLQGEASTAKASDVLTSWGFNSSNFVGGNGKVTFDLNWPGAPFNPTGNGLSGILSLHLDAGRIVDIGDSGAKMGIGRMLNILSLQTIPRRLSLNFSDLFEKGYSFDSMNSDFTFKNGNAFTDHTRFDGPVADIEISGRIGVAAKDYDIKLGVTPHVTSSLPLVAVAWGGPIAGIATWLVDRVVSSQVSKITTYRYHITGPWDKPNWNQVGA